MVGGVNGVVWKGKCGEAMGEKIHVMSENEKPWQWVPFSKHEKKRGPHTLFCKTHDFLAEVSVSFAFYPPSIYLYPRLLYIVNFILFIFVNIYLVYSSRKFKPVNGFCFTYSTRKQIDMMKLGTSTHID